ncbi:proton-translocating transhydrogenase family protein, partial [Ancylobacter radicis]
MANPVVGDPVAQNAAEGARVAAEVARQAADAAQAYAEAAAQHYAEIAGNAAHALSGGAIDPFVFRLAIFVLAVFVGYYVVWSVTPALHTPLMSVTN